MAPSSIEDLFAFAFMAWSSEEGGEEVAARLGGSRDALTGISSFYAEVERLRFDVHGAWRISQVSVLLQTAEYRLLSVTAASLNVWTNSSCHPLQVFHFCLL
jgi:myotubularin-related protein 3/4